MYHHLNELRQTHKKPIVVSMGGIAASGGYYAAMAVGKTPGTIYAEPTTWTGSIGVIIPHYDASELLSEWGVKQDSVVSHRLKNMGSMSKKMTDEERQIFQALVDQGFERFKDIIKAGRPHFQENPAALDELATGQVYTAEQAKDNGLVDEIGFIEDAIDRAIVLPGSPPTKSKWCATNRCRRWPGCSSGTRLDDRALVWPRSWMSPPRVHTTSARGCRP